MEFRDLPLLYPPPERCQIALLPENRDKNRYYDSFPLDDTLVHLPSGKYINASWITIDSTTKVIATQAPLEETIDEFWEMVFTNHIPLIIMLTPLIEKGNVRSSYYWGRGVRGEYEISLLHEREIEVGIESYLLVSSKATHQEWRVRHIHITTWEDRKPLTPSHEGDVSLIGEVFDDQRRIIPFIVHCSAGVGRTGCFLALLRWVIDPLLTMEEIVIQLREERPSMVQTLEQYTFLQNFEKLRSCPHISDNTDL